MKRKKFENRTGKFRWLGNSQMKEVMEKVVMSSSITKLSRILEISWDSARCVKETINEELNKDLE